MGQRDKRFSGTFKLPVVPRPNLKVCVIGNAVHCEEAERIGVDKMSVDDLKKFNKNKKVIKKFAKKFDAFLASDTLIKQIPRLLGPGLTKAGKFPTLIEGGADLTEKIDGVRATIKFQKKGHVPERRGGQRRLGQEGDRHERYFSFQLPRVPAEEELAEHQGALRQVHHGPAPADLLLDTSSSG